MSEENKDIEERLAKLSPLAQETLASKILDTWQVLKHENATVASPYCCNIKSFSLGSALFGAIVGVAATVLGMISFMPSKVEIREVVREVPVKPTTESPANPSIDQAQPRRNVDDQLVLADPSLRDIDALIAQRETLARHMAAYESEIGPVFDGPVRPRVSPEAYRELIRDLSQRP